MPVNPKVRRARLALHLCRAMIVDFRAVEPAEAARMLRSEPGNEERAKVVESLTVTEWAQVLVHVADALKPKLRKAIPYDDVERALDDAFYRLRPSPPSGKGEESQVASRLETSPDSRRR